MTGFRCQQLGCELAATQAVRLLIPDADGRPPVTRITVPVLLCDLHAEATLWDNTLGDGLEA